MNLWFLGAGALSGLIVAVHVIVGGRAVARPVLEAAELDPVVKYTQYYCWHLATITVVLMAAGFMLAGFAPAQVGLAGGGTVMAAGFSMWGIVLPPAVGRSFGEMPQGWLFLPVAVLGGVGLAV